MVATPVSLASPGFYGRSHVHKPCAQTMSSGHCSPLLQSSEQTAGRTSRSQRAGAVPVSGTGHSAFLSQYGAHTEYARLLSKSLVEMHTSTPGWHWPTPSQLA